jgi:hypothetical protein
MVPSAPPRREHSRARGLGRSRVVLAAIACIVVRLATAADGPARVIVAYRADAALLG